MLIAMPPGHQPIHLPYAVDYTPYLTEISKHHEVEGGFAYIYKAKLYGKRVAIKVLKHKGPGPRDPNVEAKVAQQEYMLWHPLNHPNILSLKGICFFRSETVVPSFISRWQENGRIIDFVSRRPDLEILNTFEHIAMGVSYLHDNDIIHGDLRGANILVSGSGRPLVTDFGIAKLDKGRGVEMSTAMNGNYRWMAHELFRGIGGVHEEAIVVLRTKESDVWSLGMLFKEIMSGKVPYHEYGHHTVLLYINGGLMPQFPPAQHQEWTRHDDMLQEICSRCWEKGPDARPDMKNVISLLRASRSSPLPVGSAKSARSPPMGNESRHSSPKSRSPTSRPKHNQEDDTLTLSGVVENLNLRPAPHLNKGGGSNVIDDSPQGPVLADIGRDNARGYSPRRTTTSAVPPSAPLPQTAKPLRPGELPPSSPHAAQAIGERGDLDVKQPLNINRSPTQGCTVSPGVELDNFLAQGGLKDSFRVEYSHPTPYDEQTWIATCFFKGDEIAKAIATRKTLAYVEAAKTALDKLRGLPLQRHGYALHNNTKSLDLSLLEEKFVAKGAPHKPTWECILSITGEEVSRGISETKKKARQSARLQLYG